MIFAIDFDGTICENSYPEIGKEIPGAIDTIKKISEYRTIILWTCRAGEELKNAIDFCKSKGLVFDHINENTLRRIDEYGSDSRKISADFYIDDKSIFCRDGIVRWNEIEKLLSGWLI